MNWIYVSKALYNSSLLPWSTRTLSERQEDEIGVVDKLYVCEM